MVKPQPSKLMTRVRFPSSAPYICLNAVFRNVKGTKYCVFSFLKIRVLTGIYIVLTSYYYFSMKDEFFFNWYLENDICFYMVDNFIDKLPSVLKQ